MDYHELLLALHLLAEERYGTFSRQKDRDETRQMRESMKQQVSPHARTRR